MELAPPLPVVPAVASHTASVLRAGSQCGLGTEDRHRVGTALPSGTEGHAARCGARERGKASPYLPRHRAVLRGAATQPCSSSWSCRGSGSGACPGAGGGAEHPGGGAGVGRRGLKWGKGLEAAVAAGWSWCPRSSGRSLLGGHGLGSLVRCCGTQPVQSLGRVLARGKTLPWCL